MMLKKTACKNFVSTVIAINYSPDRPQLDFLKETDEEKVWCRDAKLPEYCKLQKDKYLKNNFRRLSYAVAVFAVAYWDRI